MRWFKWAVVAAVTAGALVSLQSDAPRGIENNNPLNIRIGNDWQGEVENTDGEFEQFESVEMGVRAAAKLLKNYRDIHGLTTIEQIISRWAPPHENDTAAYIKSVSARIGIAPDVPLADSDYLLLINAMIIHENGGNPYHQAQIETGFRMGFYV